MLSSFSRPHFFPGQMLDYRDFNRLAVQGEKNAALFSSQLLSGGGILLQSLKEFEIRLGTDLKVIVQPGMALLPNGEVLVLDSALVVDLQNYLPFSGSQMVTIGITHKTVAVDPYTDPEDPSIQGFRTQKQEPELLVCQNAMPVNTLELFRVSLQAQTRTLRLETIPEAWELETLQGSTSGEAVIDTRFRKPIVPLTFAPLDFPALVRHRQALYAMEDAHRRLKKIFLIDDAFDTQAYLTLLHAEILAVPFQPLKVAFLVSEFAEKLALFLESISRKCSEDQPNFDRAGFLALSEKLGEARVRHAIPRSLPFETLLQLGAQLEAFTVFGEQRFTLVNAVEEALSDLSDRAIGFPEKTTFAGHVFRRVDYLNATDRSRVTYQTSQSQVRKLQTRYASGDQVSRTGMFVRDGKITLDLQIAEIDSPVVVWFPQYIRRKSAKLEYEINGRTLFSEASVETGVDNAWKNRGLIIQPEALVPQGNRLTIQIKETDLDYGFFEAAVYQPVQSGGKE